MRSAEACLRLVASAALALLASGCASLDAPLKAIQQNVVAPVAAAVTPAPAASAPATVSAVAPPAPRFETPVPPAVQRAYDDALRLQRAGRNDEAEKALRALSQSNPELGGPHANLGLLHRQAGRLDESVAALERAVKASPQQPTYFNQLGISYREKGQFAKAREAYERAVELDPDYAAAHLNLGILHDLYLRDSAKALAEYDRYITLSAGKDATVAKWVVDLKNRKPAQSLLTRKEQS